MKRQDSMLITRMGGTFLPTPGHVRVKVNKLSIIGPLFATKTIPWPLMTNVNSKLICGIQRKT